VPIDVDGADIKQVTEQTEVEVSAADDTAVERHDGSGAGVQPRRRAIRPAVVFGSLAVVALAALAGWSALRAQESRQANAQRQLYVQVARQAAVNLTTISYTEPEADVKRILDSSTGTFHDDFERRSPALVGVVKRIQSTSQRTVSEAGLESDYADHAQVLVAVTVKASDAAAGAGRADQSLRAWRMRISVQREGDGAKVSDVEFIP
jgi:Mce-associated membrane protein